MAYVTYPEGDLWRINADGTGRMQLVRSPSLIVNPRWSPDGKEIAFMTGCLPHVSISRISALDGSPRWLMSEDPAERGDPNWSPDGKRILFGRGKPESGRDLTIVDLETHQVTSVPGSDGMWSPRWSPNGRYIVALTSPQTNVLPVFDFSTRQWHKVQVNGNVGWLAFSHDSRYVYFLRQGPDAGVFRIPVAGGKEERVVDLTKWHVASMWGFTMSLDLTDAPLVTRDVSTDDIYALTLAEK